MGALADPWVQVFGVLAAASGGFSALWAASPPRPAPAAAGPSAAWAPRVPGRWLVDARRARDCDSADLASVLARAKDGDTVYVRAGLYRGPFVVQKKLALIGLGDPGAVVLAPGAAGTAIDAGAGCDLALSSVTLRGPGSSAQARGLYAHDGARVHARSVRAEGLAIGLQAAGAGTRLSLARSRVLQGAVGVQVESGASAKLTDDELMGNSSCGLSVVSGSVQARGGAFSMNGAGICRSKDARVEAAGVALTGNVRGGEF